MSPIQLCRAMWIAWAALWVLLALRTKRARVRLNRTDALTYMLPTAAGAYLCMARSGILIG